jgi:hypothetical protein
VPLNPRPKKWISGKSVLEKARKCLESEDVIFSSHLKDRMLERNFNMQDVINVIENGDIPRPPKWNEELGQFRYVVEGKDLEGEELKLVITLSDKRDAIIIITGF